MVAALSVTNLSKSFGGQRALDGVSMSVEPGEIRALVGQNGSGKSTLIKILSGFHKPGEGGVAAVDGEPLSFGLAAASDAAGLRFVHQDLGLVDELDVVDNLALGVGYANRRHIRWAMERQRARDAIIELGYEFDVRRNAGSLAMSERTAIAIARALSTRGSKPKVLVLDEPTATLPAAEAKRLHELLRRVAASGVAVIIVSHHFDEVFQIADSVTVLRDGKFVVTLPVASLTEAELIEHVVGRSVVQFEHDVESARRGAPVLEVDDLNGRVLSGISLQVHSGEIVGVAGITGSGRDELASIVFGGRDRTGEVKVAGENLPRLRPDRAMSLGMGLVPADRHVNAAFMTSNLRENITLVQPGRHMRGIVLRQSSERSDVATWLRRLDVRPQNTEMSMDAMSGGNQQKVILARWLRMEPRILIVDEPTQGVDVGAKADIHRLISDAATQGTGVLLVSTDHEELARLCHRVLVLRKGRFVDELFGARLHADALTAATIGLDQADIAQ